MPGSLPGFSMPVLQRKYHEAPEPNDYVLLMNADEIKAEIIGVAFQQNNFRFERQICEFGGPPADVFGNNSNTSVNLFVPYSNLEAAEKILNGIGFSSRFVPTVPSEGKKTPRFKKTIIRMVAIILFILAVWGIVVASDYAANTLKAILSNI